MPKAEVKEDVQKQSYQLLTPLLYERQKKGPGEIVALTEEEAKRLCLQGVIALRPIPDAPPKAKAEPKPEPKVEEAKPEAKTELKTQPKKEGG